MLQQQFARTVCELGMQQGCSSLAFDTKSNGITFLCRFGVGIYQWTYTAEGRGCSPINVAFGPNPVSLVKKSGTAL